MKATSKKSQTKVTPARFFKSNLKVTKGGVTVEFPEDVLNHLQLVKASGKQTVHCVVTNGVIQISGVQPKSDIPVLNLDDYATPAVIKPAAPANTAEAVPANG